MTGLEKQVNDKWAMDLVAEIPPIVVNKRIVSAMYLICVTTPWLLLQVACDGGGGALGHPKVYINLEDGKPVACIYCQTRYVFKPWPWWL